MKVVLHGGPLDTFEVDAPSFSAYILVNISLCRIIVVGKGFENEQSPVDLIARYEPREIVAEFDPVNGGYTKETVWTFVGFEK